MTPLPQTLDLGHAALLDPESFPYWLRAQANRDDDIGHLAREKPTNPQPGSTWWEILCEAIVEWCVRP